MRGRCLLLLTLALPALAQTNLVTNPRFEARGEHGFAAGWGVGEFGRIGQTLFLEPTGGRAGGAAIRLVGTPNSFTTCRGEAVAVRPDHDYFVTWWFRAEQPVTSRSYLFLQTNLAQRVFPQTDQRGDFPWTFALVRYHTAPGETSIAPVLTMHTVVADPAQAAVGASWWSEVGVYETLPADLQATWRQAHPWDDASTDTRRVFARTPGLTVWGDRAESRIYPQTPAPDAAPQAAPVQLTAPGRGHDLYQLVVTPTAAHEPVTIRLVLPPGLPEASLRAQVARCVPVKEVRDKTFPLGPTPDPLLDATAPEPVGPNRSAIFWLEWAPGVLPAGTYEARVELTAGGRTLATVPLRLKRWAFDLPEVPRFRSMVLFTANEIIRFHKGLTEEQAQRLAWDLLSRHRLSAFNLALSPSVKLEGGKPVFDWARFDRIVAAAKEYHATAMTLGPMFGGGAGQGWKPYRLAGLMPLEDTAFADVYAELNRQMAERLRAAGLLDQAYVYPYDEPEADYMDKVAAMCDLVHRGDPQLKCLMTTDPATGKPLWGKVKAWIIPSSNLSERLIAERRAAGDEIWIYNMTAAIENSPLSHRLYPWRAFRLDAAGALLWNANWWHKIDPWQNPTAEAYPVGRQSESLYHYQAGEASLFYPNPAGQGPLVPTLRLALIRQGVEDFDLLTELLAAWRDGLPWLSAAARAADPLAAARAAWAAPVMLDPQTLTTSAARVEGLRLSAGNQLAVARQRPAVLAWPARVGANLAATGWAEPGTVLQIDGKPVTCDADGRFTAPVSEAELAAGPNWEASCQAGSKSWSWAGIR